jgi:hypothetical protein
LRIVFTRRTRGVGAEGAHIQGMVEAFRGLGHHVVVDCLPGCDPSEDRGASRPAVGPSTSGKRRSGPIRSLIMQACRLIADRSPQFVFGAVELLYNVPLGLRLGRKLVSRPELVYDAMLSATSHRPSCAGPWAYPSPWR